MKEDALPDDNTSGPIAPLVSALTTSTPPPTDMETSWRPLSPRAIAAVLVALMGFLVFHPSLFNLLVRSENTEVTMAYVEKFYMWSRRHASSARDIKVGSKVSLAVAQFYPRKTYVIVHGFLGSGTDDWILTLKDALLFREDCNVVSAGWSAGTTTVGYYVIQSRVKSVGEDVSKLVKFLNEETGISPKLIHLIGHSLGAHVVGFTGKHLNGTIARITGLDPAGLMYHQAEATERLDKTDAVFVDVIHTHGCTTLLNSWTDCYGIDQDLGDADFWPNGGENQPICIDGDKGAQAIKEGSSCDHGLAYVFFTESVRYWDDNTKFLARPCHSWKYFNNGSCLCSSPAQYMGYNANPYSLGRFYLNTSLNAPYALFDNDCSAGSFTVIQILGLTLLSVLMLLMLLIIVFAIAQQYYGIPLLLRVREVLRIESPTWSGFRASPSSQLLAPSEEVVT